MALSCAAAGNSGGGCRNVMNVLAHTTALIVELRRNDTGDAHIVQLLESYLWTHPQQTEPLATKLVPLLLDPRHGHRARGTSPHLPAVSGGLKS